MCNSKRKSSLANNKAVVIRSLSFRPQRRTESPLSQQQLFLQVSGFPKTYWYNILIATVQSLSFRRVPVRKVVNVKSHSRFCYTVIQCHNKITIKMVSGGWQHKPEETFLLLTQFLEQERKFQPGQVPFPHTHDCQQSRKYTGNTGTQNTLRRKRKGECGEETQIVHLIINSCKHNVCFVLWFSFFAVSF